MDGRSRAESEQLLTFGSYLRRLVFTQFTGGALHLLTFVHDAVMTARAPGLFFPECIDDRQNSQWNTDHHDDNAEKFDE
jgi:hypothetical protein